MNNKKIPLIKEYHIETLEKCLECFDKHPFNRERQKNCVLNLYANKKGRSLEHRDKSIFRGMVISSLKYLGLIVGDGDSFRASANGKLIIESQSIDAELHDRVLRAVTYELDKKIFGFTAIIRNHSSLNEQEFINEMSSTIEAKSEKQKKERIVHWTSVLRQVGLITCSAQAMSVNEEKYRETLRDADMKMKNNEAFKRYFFAGYAELGKSSAGVVDIVDMRQIVSVSMLRELKVILTEDQFDEMLGSIPFETSEYIISFGKPMGAQEKLFKYRNSYFRTLFIKTLKREVSK